MPNPFKSVPESQVEPLPQPAVRFIPHRGVMCVIDHLVAVADKTSEAVVTVSAESPFVREDGTLEESLFIEMIAQTIAAGAGYEMTEEKRKTHQGYLLGIRNMKITGTAKVGDRLSIKAVKYLQYENFCVIEGSVHQGANLLAQGEIKVIQLG